MGKNNEGITPSDLSTVEGMAVGLGIDTADIFYTWDAINLRWLAGENTATGVVAFATRCNAQTWAEL